MLSAPIVITAPTGDIIDPAKMRLFLRIDGSDLDDEIAEYVAAVVGDIERMTATRLAEQTVEIQADRFLDLAHLTIGPIKSVESIQYQDMTGTVVELPASAYELFGADLARGVRPTFGQVLPSARVGTIVVRLVVGYGPCLPPSILLAIKEGVRSRFDGTSFDLFTATVNDRIWL